jgi:CRP/FNR family transcriptional regulator, cyclic AMP receptor protein
MFNRTVYVKHLTAVPLFRACSRKELQELAKHAEQQLVAGGTIVVAEGGKGQEFFVIASGKAKVSRNGRTVANLGPGDHFGELSLLADQPRNATVTAVTDLELIVLHRRAFLAAVASVETLTMKLLRSLANRVLELDRNALN